MIYWLLKWGYIIYCRSIRACLFIHACIRTYIYVFIFIHRYISRNAFFLKKKSVSVFFGWLFPLCSMNWLFHYWTITYETPLEKKFEKLVDVRTLYVLQKSCSCHYPRLWMYCLLWPYGPQGFVPMTTPSGKGEGKNGEGRVHFLLLNWFYGVIGREKGREGGIRLWTSDKVYICPKVSRKWEKLTSFNENPLVPKKKKYNLTNSWNTSLRAGIK